MDKIAYWSMTDEQRAAYDRASLAGQAVKNCLAGNKLGLDLAQNATPTPMDRQIRNELMEINSCLKRIHGVLAMMVVVNGAVAIAIAVMGCVIGAK